MAGWSWSPSNTMSLGLRPTSLPSSILIHPAIWPKQIWAENWGLRPLLGRGAGSPSNTMSHGMRPTSLPSGILIHPAIWPQQIWAENWGLCPFEGGGAGSPSNIMWPGLRPTCMPSFILIHPTVWPQYTNVTDRQTDNGLIAQGEPFYKWSHKKRSLEREKCHALELAHVGPARTRRTTVQCG